MAEDTARPAQSRRTVAPKLAAEARLAATVAAAEALAVRLGEQVHAAEAASERLRAGLAEALAAAEASHGRLTAPADADRAAANEPFAIAGWPAAEAAGAVAEGLTEARRQVLSFIAGRIRQALEAQAELMACRNLDEMRTVQGRFMRAAVEEFANESAALMQLGSDVAARSMPPVRPR